MRAPYHYCLLGIIGIALVGCNLMPKTELPNANPPNTLRSGLPIVDRGNDFSTFAWWDAFKDPQLSALVRLALKENNEIHVAMANVKQADAQLTAAKYAWLPTAGLQGGSIGAGIFDSSLSPANSNASLSGTRNNILSVNYAGFIPSFSLNVFSVINQTKIAKASLEIRQATYNSVRLAVIGEAVGGYFTLISARRERDLQMQKVDLLTELRQIEGRRVSVGLGKPELMSLIEMRIQRVRADIKNIDKAIAYTENALQLLCGKNPGELLTIVNPIDFSVMGLIPDNLSSDTLFNRPDLIMAENNLRMADGKVGLANAAFFPDISITGIGGFASGALSSITKGKTGFWAGSANVSMPILDARKMSGISSEEAGQRAAYFNYLQVIKSVFADIENQFTAVHNATEILGYQTPALQAAAENDRITTARYLAGNSDLRSSLESKIVFSDIKILQNSTKQEQLTSLVRLFQSLAGGYAVDQ